MAMANPVQATDQSMMSAKISRTADR